MYREKVPRSMVELCADVHIGAGSDDSPPFTLEQAIRMASWEAFAHLCDLATLMQWWQAFYFLPAHPCASQDVVMADTDKEVDTAVVHLV